MATIHSLGEFTFQDDKIDEVRQELRRLMQVTANEQGCLQYFYIQSLDDPRKFTSYEEWATMEDLERHVEIVRASKNKIFFEYLVEPPVVRNFHRV